MALPATDVECGGRRLVAGFEQSSSVSSRLDATPVSVRGLVLRFSIAGLVALVLVAVITASASRSVGTDLAITDAKRTGWVTAVGIVEPLLTDGVLAMDHASLDALDRAVRNKVLRGGLIRVKIWSVDGTVVYSDEPRLIGERFILSAHEQEMFGRDPSTSEARVEISDLSKPQNRYETDTRLLEAYVPVNTTSGTPLLYETYFRYESVTDLGRDLWRRFAPVAIGALLALQLIQIPFAWRLAQRLRSGQGQREDLLRHAIESSDAERRRIASDLHDGVVQHFTGVSLSLEAAGWSDGPGADPRFEQAAAAVRDGVKSLRSLLVDIYPPNLREEGLASAIDDLLGVLANRGVAVVSDVDTDVSCVDLHHTTLLYRAVREALRNVDTHAAASRVTVRASIDDTSVRLVVEDNGRGFDPQQLAHRQHGGHVGLRGLASLVHESGGILVVHSALGEGTALYVSLPLAGGAR